MLFAIEWLVIGLMLALNAVFAAYEMALASVSHARLVVLANQKKKGAAAALFMKERMEGSFAVIQLGITLFGAIAAATGGATVDDHLSPLFMERFGLSSSAAEVLSLVVFVIPLSLTTIVFAELVPKLFAIQNKELVCLILSPVLKQLSSFVAPLVNAMERLVKAILSIFSRKVRALRLEPEAAGLHELQAAVALARTARVIGQREERIVLAAAQLASRPIKEVLLPAAEISMVPVHATLTEALLQAHLDLHTRFPVCEKADDPQSITGYITFKDLVVALKMKPSMPNVQGILRPIKRLADRTPIAQVLEQMMREKIHIALVVQPDHKVLGMITLEDIVEEMLGDIEDEFDHLPTHFHPAGQGWIMGGGVSMTTVFQCVNMAAPDGLDILHPPRLAEWCAAALGRGVRRGDLVRHGGLEVAVRKLRRRKVAEAFVNADKSDVS